MSTTHNPYFLSEFFRLCVEPYIGRNDVLRSLYEMEMRGWTLEDTPRHRCLPIREEILVFVHDADGLELPIPEEVRNALGSPCDTIAECLQQMGNPIVTEYSFIYMYDSIDSILSDAIRTWRSGLCYMKEWFLFAGPIRSMEELWINGNSDMVLTCRRDLKCSDISVGVQSLLVHKGRLWQLFYNIMSFYCHKMSELGFNIHDAVKDALNSMNDVSPLLKQILSAVNAGRKENFEGVHDMLSAMDGAPNKSLSVGLGASYGPVSGGCNVTITPGNKVAQEKLEKYARIIKDHAPEKEPTK